MVKGQGWEEKRRREVCIRTIAKNFSSVKAPHRPRRTLMCFFCNCTWGQFRRCKTLRRKRKQISSSRLRKLGAAGLGSRKRLSCPPARNLQLNEGHFGNELLTIFVDKDSEKNFYSVVKKEGNLRRWMADRMRGGLGCLEEEKAGRKRREAEDQLAYCTTAVTGPLQDGTDLGMGRANFSNHGGACITRSQYCHP